MSFLFLLIVKSVNELSKLTILSDFLASLQIFDPPAPEETVVSGTQASVSAVFLIHVDEGGIDFHGSGDFSFSDFLFVSSVGIACESNLQRFLDVKKKNQTEEGE